MTTLESSWRARFERFGRTYSEDHHVSGWSVAGLQRRLAQLDALVDDGSLPRRGRVLELGCGAGTYVRHLSARDYDVVGLDYALSSIARAMATGRDGRGRYVGGDGYALPFRPAEFDVVLCIGVVQVVSRPRDLMLEIARVLRPGGAVVVEALNPFGLPALARRLLERTGLREQRVVCYSPRDIGRCFESVGLQIRRRIPVCLPPRKLPRLSRLLDGAVVGRLLRDPRAAMPIAHAFWFLGRRPA